MKPHKQYDRQTKKWLTAEELEKVKAKRDKKLCRGGKDHDFVLVLPWHTTYNTNYKFNPEEYYRLMDEKFEYLEKHKERIKAIGVLDRSGWNRKETRCFMCSVCKKQKYEMRDL